MKRMPAMAAASILALMAGSASAAQMSGTISEVDRTAATFTIQDTIFTASPTNTVGPDISELQVGDEVEVFYARSAEQTDQPYNAMTITKVGDADAGRSGEVSGEIADLDATANTFVVEDKSFVVPTDARGTQLSELEEGDEVMVVYDTASAEEPIQVITLQKVN